MSHAARGFAVVIVALCAPACSSYELRGKVIDGPSSQILTINKGDPRLTHLGVPTATIQITIDPDSLGRKILPTQPIADDGSFAIPIGELGAGLLEYEVGIVVRADGYDSAVHTIRIPGRDKRLLVTMAAGPDRFRPPDDPRGEAEQFLRDAK